MKLKQFSVIVLLDLDASLEISQQWQFSIFISLKYFLTKKIQDQETMPQIFLKE